MVEVKKGQVWENPETGHSFEVLQVKPKAVVVAVERMTTTRDGQKKIVVNEREVPKDIWWAFSKAFTDLRK